MELYFDCMLEKIFVSNTGPIYNLHWQFNWHKCIVSVRPHYGEGIITPWLKTSWENFLGTGRDTVCPHYLKKVGITIIITGTLFNIIRKKNLTQCLLWVLARLLPHYYVFEYLKKNLYCVLAIMKSCTTCE